ncbi:MAG: type II toxin-antitoxin system VapC family toxin [Treponema sp.]|nr:type II toxin-antitoxin system VapC family toxin [Treponema sp.]
MKYLLDTNVLSEIRKPGADAKVKAFVNSLAEEDIFISVLSIGEIGYGIEKLPAGAKKTDLLIWLTQKLPERFSKRIIPIDLDIMAEWGRLRAQEAKTLAVVDSLIAATALARRLAIVTRNTKDFEKLEGLILINPWL